jgi:hypothetical protein
MQNDKLLPSQNEYPMLTEEQAKEETLVIEQYGWQFHYSKGELCLVLPK